MRILDKIEKIGEQEVFKELGGVDGLNLSEFSCSKIKEFLDVSKNSDPLSGLKSILSNVPIGAEGIKELEVISNGLKSFGINEKNWRIDPSIARGLGYYTGPVFETFLDDLKSIGSVFSGGWYDGLVGRFSSTSLPATGASVGIDRLVTALTTLNALPKIDLVQTKAIVSPLDAKYNDASIKVLKILRDEDIPVEMYLGDDLQPRNHIGYAKGKGIRFVLFIGESEVVNESVAIKDLESRTQESVPISDIANYLKQRT